MSAGSKIPPNYDPMIAKVICWAEDRPRAIARMEAVQAIEKAANLAKQVEGSKVWLTTEPMTGSTGAVFPKIVKIEPIEN